MKIVIATPLYPPDIADQALYVKELATRLAPNHRVTVVTYGRIPEKVPGVTILLTNKHLPAPLRLLKFTYNLLRALNDADAFYVHSGISAELPSLVARILFKTRTLIRITTPTDTPFKKFVRTHLAKKAIEINIDTQLQRPEILPFKPYPTDAFKIYDQAWNKHTRTIEI
ncbi:MAG: hypothetical protein ACE5F4_01820 [Candidatus Paceibacteria bacterium]